VAAALRIRTATDADLAAVLELWRQADAEPTHTDDLASLRRLIVRDPEALLLLIADGGGGGGGGGIVGSIIAGWDGWRGSIYRLAVAPAYRRSGCGRQLLAAAEERFVRAGAVRAQAIVVSTDEQANGFWSSSGWEQQVERLRFVKG
jgi:ribosomal protein S18 acetylase RimI-like enzyme